MPMTLGEDAASTPTCRVSPVIALLEEPRLSIPDYQRAYAWGPLQVRDLVEDVRHLASSGSYRIGTVILHRRREGDDEVLDVVDGQQRLTTLHLLARLLRQRLPSGELLAEDATPLAPWRFSPYGVEQSTAQVRANADAVRELLRGWSDDEVADFVEALVTRCEVVVIELTRLDEAFQMFDSQNSRGRELYPTDLLKAYHLREARGERADPGEMRRMVRLWESIPPAHVNALFADYLFSIRRWAYGRSVPPSGFGVEHLAEFKGIRAGDPANAQNNWAKAFVYAKNFADDHRAENTTAMRFRVMQPVEYPHQIDQPVLNLDPPSGFGERRPEGS